jgi:predicted ATP-binding protein involved in virulence
MQEQLLLLLLLQQWQADQKKQEEAIVRLKNVIEAYISVHTSDNDLTLKQRVWWQRHLSTPTNTLCMQRVW